jgi:hypothetical protein
MSDRIVRGLGSSAAVAVLALGGAAPALAAKKHHRSHSGRTKTSNTSGSSGETALTGTALSSASTAALAAVPGGTVSRASSENDGSNSSAAYEVHVTKADGSRVLVLEDSGFAVLSTTAEQSHAHGGQGGWGDHGGQGGPNG